MIWLFGSALWAPRVLSGSIGRRPVPLLWAWMRRRGLQPGPRTAVLVLLAINTVLATYSTMVMAEAAFVVVFVLTLLALDRWAARPGSRNWALVMVLLAELVWLKEAGIGMTVGLIGCYELWHRRWRRAVGVGAGVGVLLLPALTARSGTGGSTVGGRYASEIANPSQGGFFATCSGKPLGTRGPYLGTYLRQSVLPEGSPLPAGGPVHMLVVGRRCHRAGVRRLGGRGLVPAPPDGGVVGALGLLR